MSVGVESLPALPSELRPPLTRDEAVLEADRCLACGGPGRRRRARWRARLKSTFPRLSSRCQKATFGPLPRPSSLRTSSAERVRASARRRCFARAPVYLHTKDGSRSRSPRCSVSRLTGLSRPGSRSGRLRSPRGTRSPSSAPDLLGSRARVSSRREATRSRSSRHATRSAVSFASQSRRTASSANRFRRSSVRWKRSGFGSSSARL